MPAYIDPHVAKIQAAMTPAPDISFAPELRVESAQTLRRWSTTQLAPRQLHFTGTTEELAIPCRWGSLRARIFRPHTAANSSGTALWFHGGGMMLGDLDKGDYPAAEFAEVSGVSVVNVEYRLAPEHPFPAALEDAYDALLWLHNGAHGLATHTVVIGGESAGASISTSVAQMAIGGPRIDFQFLAYPKLDFVGDYPSVDENVSDGFDRAMFAFYRDCYLGPDVDPANPLVSPVFASPETLAELPPALILTADADPIRDEAERYAGLLATAGVDVVCLRAVGHTHGILDFTTDSASARRVSHAAYDLVRRFCLDRH